MLHCPCWIRRYRRKREKEEKKKRKITLRNQMGAVGVKDIQVDGAISKESVVHEYRRCKLVEAYVETFILEITYGVGVSDEINKMSRRKTYKKTKDWY